MLQIKFLILSIITIPVINNLLRVIIKSIKNIIPMKYLVRFPIVGRVSVQYPDMNEFVLMADGKDSIATVIYWQGVDAIEADEIQVYRTLLEHVSVIFDIGGNVGIYALLAASYPHQPKQIYTFEPMPTIAEVLKRNVDANGFDNIQIHETALTDNNGEIILHIPIQPTYPTTSSTNANFRNNTREVSVEAMTLDTFVNKHEIDKIDFLKIDTESTEPAVLRGATSVVDTHRPLIMCEVLLEQPRLEISEFFEDRDYQVYRIEDEGLLRLKQIELKRTATNFLFVPSEKYSQVIQDLII